MFFFEKVGKILSNYIIHFKGLKLGKHLFEFDVNDRFFEFFPEGEISNGVLNVGVELIKHSTMLELDFNINGNVDVLCDRCLEPMTIPLSYNGRLVVKFGETLDLSNDELWVINENEYELNLAQYIYESICLSLPIQRYHGIDGTSAEGCDPAMLSRINKVEKTVAAKDPRWDKLNDLMN